MNTILFIGIGIVVVIFLNYFIEYIQNRER